MAETPQRSCSNGGAEGSHRLAQQAPSRSAAAAILTAPNRNSEKRKRRLLLLDSAPLARAR